MITALNMLSNNIEFYILHPHPFCWTPQTDGPILIRHHHTHRDRPLHIPKGEPGVYIVVTVMEVLTYLP